MSLTTATRKLLDELSSLLSRRVVVRLSNGKTYEGVLAGFDHPSLNLALTDVTDEKGDKYPKVIVKGTVVSEIVAKELPLFDPREFAEYVVKKLNLHPGDAKAYTDAGIVVVLGNIRVSEQGVEGSGPLANKVHSLWQEYISERQKSRGA